MVHETDAGSLEGALADLVGRAAIGVVLGASTLLGLALLSELLRQRGRADRLLSLLDSAVPGFARTAAVSLLAIAATFAGARPAAAEESVRGWLGRPTTSTTHSAPVVTPDAIDELVESTPRPSITGPVVLVPPAIEERPAAEPAPSDPPPPPTAPSPSAHPPAPELVTYVVQRGDCLWSIAARRLAPNANGRTIDAGWRRIYDANRAAIGDNPSLIHPGLVLRLPPLDA